MERRLRALGYDVRRESFPVPAGDSWGVPVAAAPGAEDNASGVAVLLEMARLAATSPPRLPVVVVAFGAEEPRGPGDDLHHFGSQHHVARLPSARREAVTAMVAVDRVGVGPSVPVCTGPLTAPRVQRALLETARRIDVPAHACASTASDHWSFEKAGVAAARLGGTRYPAYHSADDVPSVVDPRQLARTGRLLWTWLQ